MVRTRYGIVRLVLTSHQPEVFPERERSTEPVQAPAFLRPTSKRCDCRYAAVLMNGLTGTRRSARPSGSRFHSVRRRDRWGVVALHGVSGR